MKLLSLFLVMTSAHVVQANSKFEQAYIDLNKNASVYCSYNADAKDKFLKRVNTTVIPHKSFSSAFKTSNGEFEIKVSYIDEEVKGELIVESISVPVQIERNGWRYKTNDVEFDNKMIKNAKVDLSTYEFNKLFCQIELAKAKTFNITEDSIHINIHPHPEYDVRRASNPNVQKYLDQDFKQEVILLDDYHLKGNGKSIEDFFENGYSNLSRYTSLSEPELVFADKSPFIIGPAGHNTYNINVESLEVVFTGGNHNYCMWNNARNLLDAALVSDTNSVVNFIYDTEAIVVQKGGMLSDLSISRSVFKKSNLLKNILNNSSLKERERYLNGYFDYFAESYIKDKKHLFSEIVFNMSGIIEKSKKVSGNGNKKLTVNFIYKHNE